jgi:hypothetical protein
MRLLKSLCFARQGTHFAAGSQRTRPWRKADSNSWSRFEKSRSCKRRHRVPCRSASESPHHWRDQRLVSFGGQAIFMWRTRQIMNSWATPRKSTSKSRPCTGGRAKCQVKPPGIAPRRTDSSASNGCMPGSATRSAPAGARSRSRAARPTSTSRSALRNSGRAASAAVRGEDQARRRDGWSEEGQYRPGSRPTSESREYNRNGGDRRDR